MSQKEYDIIICGAGCAGLSLAVQLSSLEFASKSILILDQAPKTVNDRTWCSWQKTNHFYYPDIHCARWPLVSFKSPNFSDQLNTSPYQYCMIRGIDFYNHCLDIIAKTNHIDIQYETVISIEESHESATVSTNIGVYRADRVFDSVVRNFPSDQHLFVWQHFKGWMVETDESCFDSNCATLMDFRIEQKGETRFMYVLPFSDKKAFVEATIFSKNIADPSYYDNMLRSYLKDFYSLDSYNISEEEVGAIPMTTLSFNKWTPHITPIGTNAGTVKPSSGYSFVRIQEEVQEIVNQIRKDVNHPIAKKARFLAYDRTLLDVLLSSRETGAHVFSLLFKRNSAHQIFKFLDEKTSLWEEIKIFTTLPFFSFLKAFIVSNVTILTKRKHQ